MRQAIKSVTGIILAAGKGTRMKSALPKVLHPLLGRPMLDYVHDAMHAAGVDSTILVLSPDLSGFENFLNKRDQQPVAIQLNRLGTADAVAATTDFFPGVKRPRYAHGQVFQGEVYPSGEGHAVLISAGDTPAITPKVLGQFVDECMTRNAKLGVIGMRVPDPFGYGRLVLTDSGDLQAIVEERDATPEIRQINLCNTGAMFAHVDVLFDLLAELEPSNAQGEYYLTDCFELARARQLPIHVMETSSYEDFAGVNDRSQLAALESLLCRRKRDEIMLSGATMQLPETIYVEQHVVVGKDSRIGPNTYLSGETRIGESCYIGPNVYLDDVIVENDAVIEAGSHLKSCTVEAGTRIAPATIRA